ncbi:MAG: tyrosine-type recombinase/integrase [Firmicutes bacterium]|nr:tyrosine-type recombinase/integrase [Bacillota bacterium]
MKFQQEFEDYLIKEKDASGSTLNAYLGDVRDFSNYLDEKRRKDLLSCGSADVAAYIMQMKEDGRSASTINRKMSSIRSYYNFLLGRKAISINPAQNIKSPRIVDKGIEYLSIEEVERILDAPSLEDAKSKRDKALLELMYATGMRATEISMANVDDLDLKIGFISCTTEGKTRIVPIGRIAKAALESYLAGPREELLRGDENSRALFVNFQGQRISRQGIWKIIKFYGEKAGIDKPLSPQILRNSFAVHMVQNGADIRTIQDLLGLEDINAAKLYALAGKNRVIDVYDRTHPRA